MAIPLLANCDIGGKDITADALLTQRALAAIPITGSLYVIAKDWKLGVSKDCSA